MKSTSELTKKYNELVGNYNLLKSILHDAEYQMVEETGRDGFASKETRAKVNELNEQIADADFDLYCFKQDNAEFVAQVKAEQAAARERTREARFEKFWNN